MGTFKEVCEAAMASEEWCKDGVDAWALSPDDPDTYYALAPPAMHPTHPFDWMHIFNLHNAPKAKEVLLASVADLATTLPTGDVQDRLNALAVETADLSAYNTWYDQGKGADRRLERHLVGEVTKYLLGGDIFAMLRSTRTLTTVKSRVGSVSELNTEIALMTTFRSRVSLVEWKNGAT